MREGRKQQALRKTARSGVVCLALFFSIEVMHISSVWAGAWTLPEGKGQFIQDAHYYTTRTYIEKNGARLATPRFEKWMLQQYAAYGLSDDWTLLGSMSQQQLNQYSTLRQTEEQNAGLADMMAGIRYQLRRGDAEATALELWYAPGWRDQQRSLPEIGTPFPEAELRLHEGWSGMMGSYNWFMDAGLGYRWRGDDRADQWLAVLAGGLRLNDRITLGASASHVDAIDPDPASPFITNAQDFDLTRISADMSWSWPDASRAVRLGYYRHISARQTGRGGGVYVGIAKQF